jgi:hypothetical protein
MGESNKTDSKKNELKVNTANTKELIAIGIVGFLVLYVGGLVFGQE